MLTKAQAIAASMFYHMRVKNADGTPARARRNGKTQTWKTRPGDFKVPFKRGMYEYGYITQNDAEDWTVNEEEATRVDDEPREVDDRGAAFARMKRGF